jgi:hypothetical protein
MRTETFHLRKLDGTEMRCSVEWVPARPYNIVFRPEAHAEVSITAADLFEGLQQFRTNFEPLGWRVLCNGARIDAWAFNMSRDCIGGEKLAVLLKPGRPNKASHELDLWGAAGLEQVGTVVEQEMFFRKWMNKELAE